MRDNSNVLGKTEKSKKISVLIEKGLTEIDKDGNESVVTISSKIKFIDSKRFMASSVSNIVNNLAEVIHKIKCKYVILTESIKDNLIKKQMYILQ